MRKAMRGSSISVRRAMAAFGSALNDVISLIVFSFLDLLDILFCFLYKILDYLMEAEWRPCYCSSSPKDMITSIGKILVSESGGSKVVTLSSTKLQLEDISDTLYSRPCLLSDVSRLTVYQLCRLKNISSSDASTVISSRGGVVVSSTSGNPTTTFTVNSAIIQMLRGKIGSPKSHPVPRWSDCHCANCNPISQDTLFVKAQGPQDGKMVEEDVLFIHGFISSSTFWTETVFQYFSSDAKSRYRMFAVDLLGFGRSPKPADSLYTLREHLEMIERSVLEPYKVKSFHIVAHSLGSLIALALAVKYPGAVKSLTLIAPPYFPVPKGEQQATQYVLRKVAPRRIWPLIGFGASMLCWYEHLSRTVSILLAKNHRFWEIAFRLITFNRVRTYLMDGFFGHHHIGAFHTLHNVICGSAGKVETYLDVVRDHLNCSVTVYHGRNDELLPIHCSYAIKSRVPRAQVKIIDSKDHVTIVVGRQKAFARELEQIWKNAKS
ncbi:2-hydroxymuconate semialdehyde hydrolase [Carex littledalei]|uniref:2-hydroxymuconate semialdehyde hydrolase n=1 Tax=Carex littledalei TaxID=544730 RepID=A0A833QMH4_9POAL|nr:2-hydroxymuconate semialdehyde hydrolase [Carex littledalei]